MNQKSRIISFSLFGMLLSITMDAQPWSPATLHTTKLSEIEKRYERSVEQGLNARENKNEPNKEEGDYHFDRWMWYWQQHLNEKGEMVSQAATYQAWKAFQQNQIKQNKTTRTTNNASWSFAGPSSSPGGYSGIGRINNIGFHPTDSNTFIVATAGGGAWRTTNGGFNWTNLTSGLPVLGTSDVVYNPLNPNTIYLLTGDRDASDTYSLGVFKSTDGGQTWQPTGLTYNRTDFALTNAMVINSQDTNSLTIATSNGLMKSYDGGQSWKVKQVGNFKEVLYHPTDTSILYAASYSPGRVYRSTDGGQTWTITGNFVGSVRVSIAVTPAAINIVKAVVSNNNHGLQGIFNSNDTGQSFTNIFGSNTDCSQNILNGSMNLSSTTCDGQGWYDLTIAISPLNASIVYVGGVNTYRSTNGGVSWALVNQWWGSSPGIAVVHADKHKLKFNPLSPAIYECNDGGVYKSYNPLTWTDLTNGLQITQFYRIASSNVANFVIAGAQDNGSKRVHFSGVSKDLTGGDGMDCQMDYVDSNTYYTSTQYGNFNRTTNNGFSFKRIGPTGVSNGAWVTPLEIGRNNPMQLFVGYDHVYTSYDQGDNWADISPNFPTGSNITRLSVSPLNPNAVLVLQGASLRYTSDLGNTWQPIILLYGTGVSDIMLDVWDSTVVWVTYGGFTGTKVARYQFGNGWSRVQDSIPNIPIKCINMDSQNGTLYIGTDIGVFFKDTASTFWKPFINGLPVVPVTDLTINYATNEIWASTYGRGIWHSPRYMISTGVPSIPFASDVVKIIPNPNRGKFRIETENKMLKGANASIAVYNFSGQAVAKESVRFSDNGVVDIHLSNVPAGTYMIEIWANNIPAAKQKLIVY
ncbi:MAG: T9SS type A sorting domain-containing protein [Bacteroidetes bacterium]|nr:T9SS type A sorting domain-containing protein [Bacteroidota bacterium]MBS1740551.1 T9SS type A sorting domain-containing protein [Bacteroidota bacterium]